MSTVEKASSGRIRFSHFLLAILAGYALILAIPEYYRIVWPMGALGIIADNDGWIVDAKWPFATVEESPARLRELPEGKHYRVDLATQRCAWPYDDGDLCRGALAVVGGRGLVWPGTKIKLSIEGAPNPIPVEAKLAPISTLERFYIFATTSVGIFLILASSWLVWFQPSLMSWGLFLALWTFNPAQSYVADAALQPWPLMELLNLVFSAVLRAVGLGGLLLFAATVPCRRGVPLTSPQVLAPIAVALVSAVVAVRTFGCYYGAGTELETRTLMGATFAISLISFLIVLVRRKSAKPRDKQRLLWVLVALSLGLPCFAIAEMSDFTSLFSWSLPPDVESLLYLTSGVFFCFVWYAVWQDRVGYAVAVLSPVVIIGSVLGITEVFAHGLLADFTHALPITTGSLIAVIAVALLTPLSCHTHGALLAVWHWRARKAIAPASAEVAFKKTTDEVDRVLADAPQKALDLVGAWVLDGGALNCRYPEAQPPSWFQKFASSESNREWLVGLPSLNPKKIEKDFAERLGFHDDDDSYPVIAIRIGDDQSAYAFALYGVHSSGADIDSFERDLLQELAIRAALSYARIRA
jgi:hypothetical protein